MQTMTIAGWYQKRWIYTSCSDSMKPDAHSGKSERPGILASVETTAPDRTTSPIIPSPMSAERQQAVPHMDLAASRRSTTAAWAPQDPLVATLRQPGIRRRSSLKPSSRPFAAPMAAASVANQPCIRKSKQTRSL